MPTVSEFNVLDGVGIAPRLIAGGSGHVHSRVYFEPTRSVAYALAV
jgi:hypothetical protein